MKTVVLKGTLDSASASSLSVDVTSGKAAMDTGDTVIYGGSRFVV